MFKVLEQCWEEYEESWYEIGMAPSYRLAINVLTNIVVWSFNHRNFKIVDPNGEALLFVSTPIKEIT